MYLIKPGKLFDFMGMRRYFYLLSAVLVIGSIITFFVPGPRWGTDFKGGTELVVAFKQPVEPGAVREAIEGIKTAQGGQAFEAPEVVAVPDQANHYLIRVQEVSSVSEDAKLAISRQLCFADADAPADCSPELTPTEVRFSPGGEKITIRYDWQLSKLDNELIVDGKTARQRKIAELTAAILGRMASAQGVALVDHHAVEIIGFKDHDSKVEVRLKATGDQLMAGIKAHFGPEIAPEEPVSTEWIGAKAGAELRENALKSIGIAVFIIMVYIAFRFDLRFAPGALVSLVHDVLIAIGAMCLTGREIGISTVAAVLTVAGYTLTDTVVVYDRIRENLGRHRGLTFPQLVNLSASEMLGRTLVTNLTVIASLTMFLVFGTQVIRDFAFVMLVGTIVGTYSSIYVAGPITEWVDRALFAQKVTRAKVSRSRAQKRADAVV
ncbi:MAG: protein translocase subunit SecF [Polyangiaceae bacterium]|jgi:preprotein translocase subunit SecF|nr:protein translocase subunit SecF [Polyangiaceae bacterium]MBK8941728.1 protein translocase subunit SecF [Polyangiaceae bacterium]